MVFTMSNSTFWTFDGQNKYVSQPETIACMEINSNKSFNFATMMVNEHPF
jgi:hypothetical protein